MALKAGRRGLHKRLVDAFGNFNGEAPSESVVTDIVSGATATVNRLVKYGKIVQCFVTLTDVTLSSGNVLFKVPSGYRTIQTFRSVAFNTSSNVIEKNISISSGGDVVILGSVSNVSIMVTATWIID